MRRNQIGGVINEPSQVPLPDYGETLRPDFAVRELEPKDGASALQK
jgi:hypothetical protein